MSHIDAGQSKVERDGAQPIFDGWIIACCLPVVLISAIVIAISGGVNLGFLIPAIVCGAMVGMLMFVSVRDRTEI